MALPILSKVWQVSPNIVVGGATTLDAGRSLLYTLKSTLIGFALNPWQVVSSSDGSSAGPTDLWGSSTDINWTATTYGVTDNPTAARSWVVLKQTGMASANFQILFDCVRNVQASGWEVRVYFSPAAGFTGGTFQLRPTATDEIWHWNDWNGSFSAEYGRMHVWQSTDGECTRAVYYRREPGQYMWMAVETPANPQPGWTNPFLFQFEADDNTNGMTFYGDLNTNARYRCDLGYAYLTAEGLIANPSGIYFQQPDELLEGAVKAVYPQGLASESYGWRGTKKGEIVDQWWFAGSSDKNTVPDDTSRQFIVIGDMLLPWDGSLPLWS